jgi:anti-sigma factor RsiW
MNCETFNDRLPECLDGALTETEAVAASAHARECAACRKELARQERLAKAMRGSLERDARGLSLSVETRQRILRTLETKESTPTDWGGIRTLFAVTRERIALGGTVTLCLLLSFCGGYLYLRSKNSPPRQASDDKLYSYNVDVPLQTEIHVFRAQGDTIVDAIITEAGVAEASFVENTVPQFPPKSQTDQTNL